MAKYARKGRKRYSRFSRTANRYARAHYKLLKRNKKMQWKKKHALKYNKSRIGIPNKSSVVLKHNGSVHPAGASGLKKFYVVGDKVLDTINTARIFSNDHNKRPLGFASQCINYRKYKVNALKLKFFVQSYVKDTVHIFLKWCSENADQLKFEKLDFHDKLVHRGIQHVKIHAYEPKKNETALNVFTDTSINPITKKFSTYATAKGACPSYRGGQGSFVRTIDLQAATYHPASTGVPPKWDYTIADNFDVDAAGNAVPARKWWLCMCIYSKQPITGNQGEDLTDTNFVMTIKSKWFMKFFDYRHRDDQETMEYTHPGHDDTWTAQGDHLAT